MADDDKCAFCNSPSPFFICDDICEKLYHQLHLNMKRKNEPRTVSYTSDRYDNLPFKTLEEMNSTIIKRHNERVKPEDIVILNVLMPVQL